MLSVLLFFDNFTIDKMEHQMKRLDKKIIKTRKEALTWYNYFLPVFIKDIENATGLVCKRSGPFGLSCKIYLDFSKPEDDLNRNMVSITLRGCEFVYETEETTESFPKGSIGDVGGMNTKTKPLPDDIDGIIAILTGNREILPEKYK